jgi:hypothetical protein
MADSEQERSEAPTQKRRDEAAAEGRIPRSQDLNAAVLLLASALAVNATAPALAAALRDMMGCRARLHRRGPGPHRRGRGRPAPRRGVEDARRHGRLLGAMSLAALAVSGAQARGTFSAKPLAPKFERIDPRRTSRGSSGKQRLVELASRSSSCSSSAGRCGACCAPRGPRSPRSGSSRRARCSRSCASTASRAHQGGHAYLGARRRRLRLAARSSTRRRLRMTKEGGQAGEQEPGGRPDGEAAHARARPAARPPADVPGVPTADVGGREPGAHRRGAQVRPVRSPRALTCSPSGAARWRSASSSSPSTARCRWSRTFRSRAPSWPA